MLIIGVDFHSRFQQIAMVDTEMGELIECRLDHENGEAEQVLRRAAEASTGGHGSHRLRTMVRRNAGKLGHELWVGDAAQIRAAMVRKQKTDSRDALHILDLLLQDRFPGIWIPSPAERDLRQLLRTVTRWFAYEPR